MSEQELMQIKDGMDVSTETRAKSWKQTLREMLRDVIRERHGGLTIEEARGYQGRLLEYVEGQQRRIVRLLKARRTRCLVKYVDVIAPKFIRAVPCASAMAGGLSTPGSCAYSPSTMRRRSKAYCYRVNCRRPRQTDDHTTRWKVMNRVGSS